MSPTRRDTLRAGMLGLLLLLPLPLAWGAAPASAQDFTTIPLPVLIAQAEDLPPLGLYTLAGRLFAAERRDEAAVWFYVAQLRARLRLSAEPDLPPDGEPALYASLNDVLGREINGWAFGDVDQVAAEMTRALDWDSAHPNAVTSKSRHAAALEQVRAGLVALRARVLAEKDDIRRQRSANGLGNR